MEKVALRAVCYLFFSFFFFFGGGMLDSDVYGPGTRGSEHTNNVKAKRVFRCIPYFRAGDETKAERVATGGNYV